ncbi:uncharacterized protein TNCV_1904771 [Trichonephila clavipes]|nr:uncharacterized protein TNCV_1904771 [Trichonephila clavipes]
MDIKTLYTFDVFAWTDSKIVLSWLSSHPRKWKTFVANRTSEIMKVLPTKHWRHVPSKENPADIASQCIDPKCLPDCKLWWQGPPWLRLETSSWPKAESSHDEASDERVLGETILTFEELTTLLTQIEGLLNSRPLSYVNDSDIECISTLTPSHFLTGDVLLSFPEELPSTSNHRDRWELLQNIKRDFWKLWSADYLSSSQPRKKWQDAQPNLKEDDIVLIKEEGPPGTWPMARVLQVHPGNDGLVRVATVKTQDSVLKRPVHKLHKLPIYPN